MFKPQILVRPSAREIVRQQRARLPRFGDRILPVPFVPEVDYVGAVLAVGLSGRPSGHLLGHDVGTASAGVDDHVQVWKIYLSVRESSLRPPRMFNPAACRHAEQTISLTIHRSVPFSASLEAYSLSGWSLSFEPRMECSYILRTWSKNCPVVNLFFM